MQDTQENKNNNKLFYAFIVLFGYIIYSNFTSLTSIKNDIADIQIVLQVFVEEYLLPNNAVAINSALTDNTNLF